MFSKLSVFVAITLAAFATAAGLPQAQGGSSNIDNAPNTDNKKTDDAKTLSCPSPVKCCESYFTDTTGSSLFIISFAGTNKHQATDDDVKLAHDKLGVDISPLTDVWVVCSDFAQGPGKTWYD